MNSQSENQSGTQNQEQIFTISNEVFRIKKNTNKFKRKDISVPKKKGFPVKNQDFSYENFNLNENFQKSELNAIVFSKISKTINLVRIFEFLHLKKIFAKWSYNSQMCAAQQNLLKNMNYQLVKLLTFWNHKDSDVKREAASPDTRKKRELVIKTQRPEVQLEKQASKSNETLGEKAETKEPKEEVKSTAVKAEEKIEIIDIKVKEETKDNKPATIVKEGDISSEINKNKETISRKASEKPSEKEESAEVKIEKETKSQEAEAVVHELAKGQICEEKPKGDEVQQEKLIEVKLEKEVSVVELEKQKSEVPEEKVSEVKLEKQISEIKQEEKVAEAKQEEKVAEIKQDEKVAEAKQEEKVAEIKQDEKVSEVKLEKQISEIKQEEKVAEAKQEEKVAEAKQEEKVGEIKQEKIVAKIEIEEVSVKEEKPKEELPTKSEKLEAKAELNKSQDDPAVAKADNAVEAPKSQGEAKCEDPAKAEIIEDIPKKDEVREAKREAKEQIESKTESENKTEERKQEAKTKPEDPAKPELSPDSAAKAAKQDSFVIVEKADLSAEVKPAERANAQKEEPAQTLDIVSCEPPMDPLREKLCRKISEIKASLNSTSDKKIPSDDVKIIEGDFVMLNHEGESPQKEFDESIHLQEDELNLLVGRENSIIASKRLSEELEHLKKLAKEKEAKLALLTNANEVKSVNLLNEKVMQDSSSKRLEGLNFAKEILGETTEILKKQQQEQEQPAPEKVVCAEAPAEKPQVLSDKGEEMIVCASANAQPEPLASAESKTEKVALTDMSVSSDSSMSVSQTNANAEVKADVGEFAVKEEVKIATSNNTNNTGSGNAYSAEKINVSGSTATNAISATAYISNSNANNAVIFSSDSNTVPAYAVRSEPYTYNKYISGAINTQVTSYPAGSVGSGASNAYEKKASVYVSYNSGNKETANQYKSDVFLVSNGNAVRSEKYVTNYLNQSADLIKPEEKREKYYYIGNAKLNTITESSSEYQPRFEYSRSSVTEVPYVNNALNKSNSNVNATNYLVSGGNNFYKRTSFYKAGEDQATLVSCGNPNTAPNATSYQNKYYTSNVGSVPSVASNAYVSKVSGSTYVSGSNNNNIYTTKTSGLSKTYVSGSNANNAYAGKVTESKTETSQFDINIKKIMSDFDSEFLKIQNKLDKVSESRETSENLIVSSSNTGVNSAAKAEVNTRLTPDSSTKYPAQYITGGTKQTNSSTNTTTQVIDLVSGGNKNLNRAVVESELNTSAANPLDISLRNAASAQSIKNYYNSGAQSNIFTTTTSSATPIPSRYVTYVAGSSSNNFNNVYSTAEIVSSGSPFVSKASTNYNYTSYGGNVTGINAASGKYISGAKSNYYTSAGSNEKAVGETIDVVSCGPPIKTDIKLEEISSKVNYTKNTDNDNKTANAITNYVTSNANTYTNTYTSSNSYGSNYNKNGTYYVSNTSTKAPEPEVISTGFSAAYYKGNQDVVSGAQGKSYISSQNSGNKYYTSASLTGKITSSIDNNNATATDYSNILVSSGNSNAYSGSAAPNSSINTLSATGIFSAGAGAQSKYLAGNSTAYSNQGENPKYNSSSNYNYVTSSNYSGYSSNTAQSDVPALVSNGAFHADKYYGTNNYTASSAVSEKSKYEEKLNETLDAIKNKKQTQPTANTKNIEQMLANAKLTTSYFATSEGGNVGFGNTKESSNNVNNNDQIINALFKDDPKGMEKFKADYPETYKNLVGKKD